MLRQGDSWIRRALAILDAPVDEWRQLEPGKVDLVDFVNPKSLRG